jgi:dTDP-4-amino-4,6-dideoxygalactose transaminase
LRQLIDFSQSNQFEKILAPSKIIYYYRGANAIFNAVKALGLKSEDIVLMPAYHCGIELEAVLKAGCQVRFYGIASNLEINWNDLDSQIGPQTKALFIIHYFGFPQDMEKVKKICEEKKLF